MNHAELKEYFDRAQEHRVAFEQAAGAAEDTEVSLILNTIAVSFGNLASRYAVLMRGDVPPPPVDVVYPAVGFGNSDGGAT